MSGINATLDQLLAGFPDNTNRQIHPQQSRNLTQSAMGATYPFDPGAGDDRNNFNGNGFFDYPSRWFNTVTGDYWLCQSGAPGAAVWVKLYPQGGGGGGVTSVAATRGTRTASGLAITSTGVIWGDSPYILVTTNYNVLDTDEGTLFNFATSGIVVTWTTPGGGFFQNGWYMDCHIVTTNDAVQFSASSPIFTGGGYAWSNKSGGTGLLQDFYLVGGDSIRMVSDGTGYHVQGLKIFRGTARETGTFTNYAPGVETTVPFGTAVSPLGFYGPTMDEIYSNFDGQSFVAPMVGFYSFTAFMDFTGPYIGPTVGTIKVIARVKINGVTQQTYQFWAIQNPTAAESDLSISLDFIGYMDVGDLLTLTIETFGAVGLTDDDTYARFVFQGT